MGSDVQGVSGIFVFCAHGGEYKSKGSKTTCSEDKIAAEKKSRECPVLDLIKFRIMHVIRMLGE